MHNNQYTRESTIMYHAYFHAIIFIVFDSIRFIPPGQGGIEMNDNIVYQRSAGVSTAPPAGVDTKPPETDGHDHIYEMLPCEIEEAASKRQESWTDDKFQPEKQSMNETKKNENTENDYYVNDDLFPKQDEEEDHTSLTCVHVKDSSGDDDYYVNDDLFPNSITVQAVNTQKPS